MEEETETEAKAIELDQEESLDACELLGCRVGPKRTCQH